MGEQNDSTLYYSINGGDYEVFPNGFTTLTAEEEQQLLDSEIFPLKADVLNQKEGFTVTVSLGKFVRVPNRKRFIRLCMANGQSRNFANFLAQATRNEKISYQTAYLWMLIVGEMLKTHCQPDSAP